MLTAPPRLAASRMGAGTGFPSSSTLAQTWNAELAQEEGRTIGTQALQNGYTGWYAPATNMHRRPLQRP